MPTTIETPTDKTSIKGAYSLRTRYLTVTVLITLLIIASALFAQHYVEHVGELRSKNLRLRNEASTHIRQLRDALVATEKNLDAFLWLPDQKRRDEVNQSIDKAIIEQQHLYHLQWFNNSHMVQKMDDFGADLQVLRASLTQLMDTRTDPSQHDPFITLHSEIFQPATHDFTQAITAALQDIEAYPDEATKPILHKQLEDLLAEWMRVDILAESYSGISSDEGHDSGQNIKTLMQKNQALLTRINSLKSYFSKTPQLKRDWMRVQEAISHWKNGVNQLRELSAQGEVRGDIHFLLTSVEPQLSHIWNYLKILDATLEDMSRHDADELEIASTAIAHALWLLAILGLGLLLTALLYFERNVLAPIALVAKALRTEARGMMPPPLPPVHSRETHHLIDAFNHMRLQVQQRQQSLEHLALHDTLTGIANREQLMRFMPHNETSTYASSLLVVGLNRFKEVNNSLGHTVGDNLLIAVADRLKTLDAEATRVARIGDDVFAILADKIDQISTDKLAHQIQRELEVPFAVANQSLYISASIGIASAPEHGNSPIELLQKAEVAMQVAKKNKSGIVYYSSEYDRHAMRSLSLASDLQNALKGSGGELTIVYQPQIDISTGVFCGMEALLRWHHPVEGIVSPDELIPIAENTGIIVQLTPWVLERAFEEYTSMKHVDMKPQLAINMSVFNLYDSEFPRKLEQLMSKWSVEPGDLQLEITESAMMQDPERAYNTLYQINNMGIELAIDDFGTGFSSLSYLKHLPVSKLKIDKSFVMSMLLNDNDAVIIRSTIDMAHNLGLKVVAEGVENQESLDLLSILDCDIAQGYLFSPPLPLHELLLWQRKPLPSLLMTHRRLMKG